MICNACEKAEPLKVTVYETAANGNQLTEITAFFQADVSTTVKLIPEEKFQTITGFGGSFTEASAYLLNQLGSENRAKIIVPIHRNCLNAERTKRKTYYVYCKDCRSGNRSGQAF